MKKLLNTLYITSEDSYLALDGENIVVFNKESEIGRVPLHKVIPRKGYVVSYMLTLMDSSKEVVVTTYREGVSEGIAARAFMSIWDLYREN